MQRGEQALRIDRVCDTFEAAWRTDSTVRIEAFLNADYNDSSVELLPWLLSLEVALRRSAGESVFKDEYLARFPDRASCVEIEFSSATDDTRRLRGASAGLSGSTVRPEVSESRTPSVREIAGYELLEEIGRGGMGIVYRARQSKLDRDVAIKVIRAGEFAREEDRQRFRIEAAAAAQLDHPGIVQVFEVGEWHEQLFYVMAFVEGETLASRLSRGPLAAEQAARLVWQISEAVQAAHSKGIVHRDLKPSNILLDESERPRVADFSLALRLDTSGQDRRDPTVTITGQIVGTPNYMSPEQASARAELIGVRSDVYSLGAILYALLTGRPPFQAENPLDTLQQVRENEPVSPRRLNPRIARDLETIALKCLEKDPQRRYATAQELADELQRFLDQRPIFARPISIAGRAWRWAKRQPAVAAGVAVSALLSLGLIVGATVAVTIVNRKNSEKTEIEGKLALVERSEQRALAAQRASVAAEQRSTDTLYQSLLVSARSAATGTRPGRRFQSLATIKEAAAIRPSDELRDLALLALSNADMQLDRRIPVYRGDVHSFVADRELRQYAKVGTSGMMRVHILADDAITHELPASIPNPTSVMLQFSPSGYGLAVIWNILSNEPERLLTFWDLTSHKKAWELPLPRLRYLMEFSPDGRWLLLADTDDQLLLYDVESQQRHAAWKSDVVPVLAAFSPDGQQLAVSNRQGSVALVVYDLASQKVLSRTPHPAAINGIDWHPDGHRVATAGEDAIVRVVRTDVGQVVLSGLQDRPIKNLKYTYDGSMLATNTSDFVHTFWWARTMQPQFSFPGPPAWIRFRPDDERFGWIRDNNDLLVYQLTTVPAVRRFSVRGNDRRILAAPALRHDGRFLATSNDRETMVWDTRQGSLVAEIAESSARPHFDRATGDLILQSPSKLRRWRFAEQLEEVETGKPFVSPSRPAPRNRALSENGRLTAFVESNTHVVLADAVTNRTFARFEPTAESPITDVLLSDDGAWLVVQNQLGDSNFYDLRILRQQLLDLNLAGDWPEYEPGNRVTGNGK